MCFMPRFNVDGIPKWAIDAPRAQQIKLAACVTGAIENVPDNITTGLANDLLN